MIGLTMTEGVLAAATILFLVGMFIGLSIWMWRKSSQTPHHGVCAGEGRRLYRGVTCAQS